MAKNKRPVAKWKPHKFNEDKELDDIEEEDTPKAEKKIRHQRNKWDDRFFVTVYQLAKDGRSHSEIAKALGVDDHTLKTWRAKKPALQEAYKKGTDVAGERFEDYVYDRLPKKLQETWKQLKEFDDHPNALRKITSLMLDHGKRERQHLFIQALISRNFNPSIACSSIGISYQQLMTWCRTDAEFSEILKEIEWHRKNFYEDSLFRLVKDGNPSATIFVNKTKNQDRGYGAKLQVEHSGSVNHNHQTIDLETINLPLEIRKVLLEYIEEAKMKALPAPKPDVIDANYEIVDNEEDVA